MMKYLILALLFGFSGAFAQSHDDPFGSTPVDPHGTFRRVLIEYEHGGTREERYAIEHQSDYGYSLSDSITFLQIQLSECIDAARGEYDDSVFFYSYPTTLGDRVDSIVGHHGYDGVVLNGVPNCTRAMLAQATGLVTERLNECLAKWNALLKIYRESQREPTVTVIVGSLK